MPVATPIARPLPALRTPPGKPSAWTVLLPHRSHASWLSVGIAGLFAANLTLYVVTVVQEATLNRIQAEIFAKREHNIRLRAELATAESPDVVETRATDELKMSHGISPLFLPALPADHPLRARIAAPAFGVPEAY